MNRRRFFVASLLVASTFVLSACMDAKLLSGLVTHQLDFGPADLQRGLDSQFPRGYKAMGGLVTLNVVNPRLGIPDDGNRLRVDFDVDVGKHYAGSFGISSGIRYDNATLGLYLQDPQIESLHVPVLGGALGGDARTSLNDFLGDYARAEPIYRVDPNKLHGQSVSNATISNGHVILQLASSSAVPRAQPD